VEEVGSLGLQAVGVVEGDHLCHQVEEAVVGERGLYLQEGEVEVVEDDLLVVVVEEGVVDGLLEGEEEVVEEDHFFLEVRVEVVEVVVVVVVEVEVEVIVVVDVRVKYFLKMH
jgi:hypothetical protein